MDQDGTLIRLMQKRGVLKKKLREWTRKIKAESGREPSPADCELNRPMLVEYKEIKERIERITASQNEDADLAEESGAVSEESTATSSPAADTSALALPSNTSSWFAGPSTFNPMDVNPMAMAVGMSGMLSSAADSVVETVTSTAASSSDSIALFFEGVPTFSFLEWDVGEAHKPTATAAPLNDDAAPMWQRKWEGGARGKPRAEKSKKKIPSAHSSPASHVEVPASMKGTSTLPSPPPAEAPIAKEQEPSSLPLPPPAEPISVVQPSSSSLPPPSTEVLPVAEPLSGASQSPPDEVSATDEPCTLDPAQPLPAPSIASVPSVSDEEVKVAQEAVREELNQIALERQALRGSTVAVKETPSSETKSTESLSSIDQILAEVSTPLPLRLAALAKLKDSGLASEDDFNEAKRKLFAGIMPASEPPRASADTSQDTAEDDGEDDAEGVDDTKQREEMRRTLDRAIRQFNLSAKRGIKFIISEGMVSESPEEVADFLCNTRGLNKAQIGEYLGDPADFNVAVLRCLARMFNFELSFIAAIRMYLQRFRLPGEAQKIDRILEAFAEAYFEAETEKSKESLVFSSADTVHILAFSVIMLNTDAHNPSMAKKDRMTKEQFLRNNRGIDDGKDLPRPVLEGIYDDITANEILTVCDRDDDGNLFANPAKDGWMDKLGVGALAGFKKRYFISSGSLLYYFKEQNDVDPVGFIMLQDCRASVATGTPTKSLRKPASSAASSLGAMSSLAGAAEVGCEASAKEWVTDTTQVAALLVPTTSFGGRPPEMPSATKCSGKHITFKKVQGQALGLSLLGRLPGELPTVHKAPVGLTDLAKGDVLVMVDGQKIIDLPNPLSSAAELMRNTPDGPLTLTFVSKDVEEKVVANIPSSTKRTGRTQASAVTFHDMAIGKKGSAAYLEIKPTVGDKIKSVKYNAGGELVPGVHESIHLRVASSGLAQAWVNAINESIQHTVCAI